MQPLHAQAPQQPRRKQLRSSAHRVFPPVASRWLFALILPLLSISPSMAQVAAGGGGVPRNDQYFSVLPEYSSGIFVAAGDTLSAKQRAARDAAWRAEIRKQLFVPAALPPLRTKVWSSFSPMRGVLADRVTYATANGMRVPAIIYRPDPKIYTWHGKLPGIVIVNGHGGDKYSWYAFYSGLLFARAGAVVVTYDPIGEGERNSNRLSRQNPSPHDRVVDLPFWGQELAGLMQVDLMQGVSYLRSLRLVDSSRIGVLGYSMGAFVTGIAGAIDPRIHAVLLSGGGTFDGPHEGYDSGKLPCQSPPYRALGVLGDRAAILYTLNADRGPMLVMNGADDKVMHLADHPPAWFQAVKERAARLQGSPDGLFETILYPDVGHRPSWVDVDGVLWLNHHLHFALWSDDAIRNAGTTHISEWIRANGVDISPNYIREEREGGIEAVGTDFPAIQRTDLTVVPERNWQAEQSQYTYEGWAQRMQAEPPVR